MKGHIRQRSKGSWSVVLYLGCDASGKARQKWHTVRGTKRDAERELNRLLHELNTGAYVEPTRETVGNYFERWLGDYAKAKVSAKTFERYSEIIKRNVIPALGHHLLTKLQPLHIQGFYSEMLLTGRKDGKGGLSAQTVLHIHRVLHGALKQAVRWQLLVRNPADAVQPPRAVRHEIRVLGEAETGRVLAALAESRFYAAALLAVSTGMRRGEILGLRWQDVDIDGETLSVRQALEQTLGGLAFKQPKTTKSRRTVALPSIAVEALKRHRTEQARHRLLLGSAYQDGGLVFPSLDGRPWKPDAFTTGFRDLVRAAGFVHLRFHDLRHGHATHLLLHGTHPKVVSERLGHSTIGITLDTYSHVLPGLQEEAAQHIDAALRTVLGEGSLDPQR